LDTFHYVKLQTLGIIVNLMREPPADHAKLRLTADHVIDLCMAHDARQTFWVALHTRAKVAERQGDDVRLASDTRAAFEQLMSFAGKYPEMQQRFHEPMIDLAMLARKAEVELPARDVARIAAVLVRSEIEQLLSATAADFRNYLRAYKPLSTYHDGRFDLPCP
ncbi:MAG: hypothetical protein ACREMY_07915, partial [bacterium]